MLDHKNTTIPRWVSLLYRYGQIYIGEQLKGHDIGKGQYMFLNALYKEDGLSQEELSGYLKIDKGTTAKALKKLEEQGYVYRKVREEDRRSYQINLTEKSLGIKDEFRNVLTDWRSILSAGLSEEEERLTLELLEKIGRNAARYIEETLKESKENSPE